MPRGRTEKIYAVKARIERSLREGRYQPGDRFLSTRELAELYGISYATAHTLMEELCTMGLLVRRAASGTYLPGGFAPLFGVQLLFDVRAQRPQSFGARLLAGLTRRLERERIEVRQIEASGKTRLLPDYLPILWEASETLQTCLRTRRMALLLNDRPPPGLNAGTLDSVSIDDYWGGVCAAQLLMQQLEAKKKVDKENGGEFAVLTGPDADIRSRQRRDGFLSLLPAAHVVSAGSWFREDALRVAGEVLRAAPEGLFCANDRLAEAIVTHCRETGENCPPLVGFDDAPIAATLGLTTIAIPWDELMDEAIEIIRRRLSGDTSAARQRIVTPRPVVRWE